MNVLAWIGRQKSRALAVSVVIGILIPAFGALLKPLVIEAVFGLLVLAFLRTDFSEYQAHLKRPGLVIAATLWTMLLIPVLMVFMCYAMGLKQFNPDLFLGLTLQAIASPMTAAPAIAIIMGLNGTLLLVTLIASTILVPITAPLIISMFGLELSLSPGAFGLKLFYLLAGASVIGMSLRKVLGKRVVNTHNDEIDGVNILLLFVFVCAVMGGLGQQILVQPLLMLSLTALAFLIFFILLTTTFLIFKFTGVEQAFALGMLVSQRNMGLMLAGTGGLVPELTWLYFAVSQFPLYLSPLMLTQVVKCIKNSK